MLALPKAMAHAYALPRHPTFMRCLAARDLAIGYCLLHPKRRRIGAAARAVSDLVDFGFIAAESQRSGAGLEKVRGRLVVALGSALVAGCLSRQGGADDPSS
jgi:hypothetical protein